MRRSGLAILISIVFILAACRPKSSGPDIRSIVATSIVGTGQAQAVGTIVSATNAALAARSATKEPLARPATPAAATLAPNATEPSTGCLTAGNGKLSYVDAQEGYCLLYPDYFFVNKPGSGTVQFLGPPLEKSAEPLRALIEIRKDEPVRGRTLDEIAAGLWREARNPYQVSNITLGGRDALVAENLVIGDVNVKTRQVFFTHNGSIYLITFTPVDQADPFARALPDIRTFWDASIASFHFMK